MTDVRATIDPTWTLTNAAGTPDTPAAPPKVPVTFTYSATASVAPLPPGDLTLNIYVADSVSSAGGCQANVGGTVTRATCTVNIPAWGDYTLITSYSSGVSTVAATGQTETVNI